MSGSVPNKPPLKLLDLTLKSSGAIICSKIGEFTAPSRQEIVVLRTGGTIELYSIEEQKIPTASNDDDDEEEVRTFLKYISRFDTRSVLRDVAVVRLDGEKRDIIAVGADGGCISVLDFQGGKPKILHCPAFGKTGCLRGTPGQYVASDPKGRAILVAAVEKRKLVYVLNSDSQGIPTIASPLEAHRSRTITFDTVGLDNGYGNPIFAALELQYIEDYSVINTTALDNNSSSSYNAEKQLAYYELNLGLNHVSRMWAARVHRTACCIAAIPGGADAPGGVLVGGEDWIEYLHDNHDPNVRVVAPVPRRALHPPTKGILIQTITVFKQKKSFFALAQTELGDVYKVTLDVNPEDKTKVTGMKISLLDTLPVGNSLNITKKGMLFVASEFGDHRLYRFIEIELDDAPTCTSSETNAAMAEKGITPQDPYSFLESTVNASELARTFTPTVMKNLLKVYQMNSLAPTTGLLVGELAGGEVTPQIYAPCGRGVSSSLRILRHGAAVSELAVSDLPGTPGAVFTIRDTTSKLDKFIIISFADATLVLSVGDKVEEVGEGSGFLTNAPTLACSALDQGRGICQVHPAGVRHIYEIGQLPTEWPCPGLKRIETASANESQVLIALAGGEIIYFELDPISGVLKETSTRDMGADVSCLDVGVIPEGRTRSMFAAVGCRDQTVRILSLEPGKYLQQKSSTALKARVHSVCVQQIAMETANDKDESGDTNMSTQQVDTILTAGMEDGSAMRAEIDPVSGAIGTSPTWRFFGARPVGVVRASVDNKACTLLLSSRPWISRPDAASGKLNTAPLSYAPLDHACRFTSEAVREGIVATAGSTMRILAVERADDAFNQHSVELSYTPRQMCLVGQRMAIVEADHNEYSEDEKNKMGFDKTGEGKIKKGKEGKGGGDDMEMDIEDDEEEEKKAGESDEEEEDEEQKEASFTPIRGPVPSTQGHWGSCIRLLDPTNACATLDKIELSQKTAALCCCSVRFHSHGGEALLAVGTVTNMTMHPLRHSEAHVVLYRVVNGERLQLLHKTKVEDKVLAMSHFQGRLLVGVGNVLRLYEMGKKQLLRKCEFRSLPVMVKTLQTAGDRAYVGDMMQSMHYIRYDATQNRLVLIANDRTSRCITAQELLDFNTVAVADKFGNISILRLPRGADGVAVDNTGNRALWESSQDSTPKLEILCHYYVGEIVTGMTRASLVAGGGNALFYVTVTGRIGAMLTFQSRDDIEFYEQLEGRMRRDAPRPTGRRPQAYRSYYAPIKHVIDGDLCESYAKLNIDVQKRVAEALDMTIGEVMNKLEETRNSLL